MKKYILSVTVLLSIILNTSAQTNGTDFTATDCNGISHNLFTDLNNGNVVVLVWVMPCGTCISDAIGAYDAMQYFSTTNPGKVIYYLADDFGNTNCSSLSSWASKNGIGTNISVFSNAGTPISENAYGGSGMPHVVVLGGTDHKIFLNLKNGANNEIAIQNAIAEALKITATIETSKDVNSIVLAPNLVNDKLNIVYKLEKTSDVQFCITDINGSVIKTQLLPKQLVGTNKHEIDISSDLKSGNYYLQLKTGNQCKVVKFTVVH